jgi:hypothetical protein
VAFAMAVAYFVVLCIAFLYYLFFAPSKLRSGSEAYETGAIRARKEKASLNRIRRRYSQLRLTKSGLYDERSNAGKNANSEVRSCKRNLEEEMLGIQKIISTYSNASFVFYSIWAYCAALYLFFFAEVDFLYWPFGAAFFSLIVGFGAKQISGIQLDGEEITPNQLPQVNRAQYSIASAPLIASICLLAITFVGSESLHVSTERIVQGVAGEPSQVESTWVESGDSNSVKRGFLLFDVEAAASSDPINRTKLIKGSSIYILDAEHKADVSLISIEEGGDTFVVDRLAIGMFQ